MTRALFLLLLICAFAGGGEFELKRPTDDWDVMRLDKQVPSLKAHLQTRYEGGQADIRLYVAETKETLAEWTDYWASALEKQLGMKRVVREGTLGGEKCTVIDVKSEVGHVTSWVAKRGDTLYTLHVIRERAAVGDDDVEAEITQVRTALELPAPPKPAAGRESEKPKKPEPRAEIRCDDFWRLVLVKPAGLTRVAELEASEKTNNVILKLEGRQEQGRLMIRVYARTKRQARRLEDLLEVRREQVRKDYAGKPLREVEDAPRWKPPLAKKALQFLIVGKRTVTETRRFHVVDCRNDRQYEVEIYATGSWDEEIAEFLAGFRPVRK